MPTNLPDVISRYFERDTDRDIDARAHASLGVSSRPITIFPGAASYAPTEQFPRDSHNASCCSQNASQCEPALR